MQRIFNYMQFFNAKSAILCYGIGVFMFCGIYTW